MLSFVIPTYNEEQHIGPAVASVYTAARVVGEPFEAIVPEVGEGPRGGRPRRPLPGQRSETSSA